MEVLMSNWCTKTAQSLPEKYVFPPGKRPGKLDFPVCENVPVIDLKKAKSQQILNAFQEFGFFQVINHGIPVSLIDKTMRVFQEFFGMPPEYKSIFYSTDMKRKCRIYSSSMDYDKEEVHYWRDNFTHHCHPIEDHIGLWPENPTNYREVVRKYSIEGRKLLLRILDLIGEGLGLKPGYFDGGLSETQLLSINHHIPCPDPSLTVGMPEHRDPNLITMLHQCSVPGLQVFFQGQWMNIEPMENAFFVIPGMQLKAISNGKFSSPIHRVMTHSKRARTTIGTFLIPSMDILVKPAEDFCGNSPCYRGFTYKEFFNAYVENERDWELTLESFKVKE
ncbi:hyoscyamine 6-dioxygenase [Dorcoceras hygrometricum]|uniref:Hyoscyamine 6-dioxygenase n=1 Tax=Dorcoceras hygrometricum TaxID=472368 RepID=A0A2Z7BM17_9LAMI|nr:hyoscyamine 6-dioxygenase [Dorcoceras hygrometricum]